MVVVEFAYDEMKKLVDLPRDKMVSLLSELGAPAEYESDLDKVMVELTPNRPDWYSMEGLARALKAYSKGQTAEYKVKKSKYIVNVDQSVAKIRPYTVCAVVKGLKFDDQRIRDMVLLQEKLIATLGRKVKKFGLGVYPLNTIKFPVKYTTMAPKEVRYIPLGHDVEMNAEEIINNHKKGQQYGYLINRHDRYPVFVDGTGKIMCLIPIVNSAESGKVDVDTEDIFIEVTGMEMHTCKAALNILVCTFADMGGDIYDVEMVYGKERFRTPELAPKIMKLDLKDISRILGVVLKEKEVVGLLRKMGYGYKAGKVSIPPYRADIMGIIDIIEDIAIAYGYNNFKPTTANFFSAGNMIKKYDNIDRIFCGMGFFEAKTFILTNKNKIDIVGSVDEVVEISNPGTVDYTVVRPHLLVDILGIFEINKMKALPQKFYEVGVVYGDEGYNKRLVFGVMDKKIEFSEVRGYLQTFGFESGFDFHLVKKKMPIFEDEFSCVIMLKEREVGVFGKVNRKILERLGLGFEVYICEIKI